MNLLLLLRKLIWLTFHDFYTYHCDVRKKNVFLSKVSKSELTCISSSMDPRKNSALISDLKMEKSRLQHARQNPNRHVSINQPRQAHVLTFHFRIFVPNLDIFSRRTQNWILYFWWCLAWHQMALLVAKRGLTTTKGGVLCSTDPWNHKKLWNLQRSLSVKL